MADTATSQPSVKPAQKIERATIDANGAVNLSLPKEALRSVEIADVDLVLRFADGNDVVIPYGAIDALSGNAPAINFSDSQASSADLMKSAGKTAIVTAGNVRIVTEELDTRATTSQGENTKAAAISRTPAEPPFRRFRKSNPRRYRRPPRAVPRAADRARKRRSNRFRLIYRPPTNKGSRLMGLKIFRSKPLTPKPVSTFRANTNSSPVGQLTFRRDQELRPTTR